MKDDVTLTKFIKVVKCFVNLETSLDLQSLFSTLKGCMAFCNPLSISALARLIAVLSYTRM